MTILCMTSDPTIFATSDVARIGFVDTSTVRLWVKKGLITPTTTTLGGHYRFTEEEVRRALRIPADRPLEVAA